MSKKSKLTIKGMWEYCRC